MWRFRGSTLEGDERGGSGCNLPLPLALYVVCRDGGRVVELVDIEDLKSSAPQGACGFKSRLAHHHRRLSPTMAVVDSFLRGGVPPLSRQFRWPRSPPVQLAPRPSLYVWIADDSSSCERRWSGPPDLLLRATVPGFGRTGDLRMHLGSPFLRNALDRWSYRDGRQGGCEAEGMFGGRKEPSWLPLT